MEFFCLGLSHKSAPLAVRERLALGEEAQAGALKELAADGKEVLLVSTCNRVEFYVAVKAVEPARRELVNWLGRTGGADPTPHLYERGGDEAITHLFRVAASLDSMVVGEPQILGQVKEAFELAQRSGSVRGELSRACSAAFSSAKRVRSETGIGRAATSMASAAVELATKVFGGLGGKAVLVVGAGDMSQLAAKHLRSAGVGEIWVTNRTFERAEELAKGVAGVAKPFADMETHLTWADLVVCSTASLVPIFTRDLVSRVLKPRRHRPLFMVDLAVPRDIAPDVNELDDVYAYDVDDIQKVVAENAAARSLEATKAELIVTEEVAKFNRARALRDGVPVLAMLRAWADQIARSEADRTLANFGDGLTDRQKKSIEAMGMAIVNKLLHQPTVRLRQADPLEDRNRLAGAAAELFGLDEAAPVAAGAEMLPVRSGGES